MKLYLDLEKSLDTSKLVKRPVQVKGKSGTFTRMQWVDPNTGKPVLEDSHPDHVDHHKTRISALSGENRHKAVHNFVSSNRDRANTIAEAMGQRRARFVHQDAVTDHLKQNMHKIPHDDISPHIDALSSHIPKASIDNKDLPQKEIDKRMGKSGSLDISKLYEGSSIESSIESGKKREFVQSLLGDLTQEGFNYVLSGDNFSSRMIDFEAFDTGGSMYLETGSVILNKDRKQIGSIIRKLGKNGDGNLVVENTELNLDKKYQGKGIASNIYSRSEDLWRHLSKGNPFEIHLTANISVGVYAWAKKGFDFINNNELQKAKAELRQFCKLNDISLANALEYSGYGSLNDLTTVWHFATLKDGTAYDIENMPSITKDREKWDKDEEVEGIGHLGKAFMLRGKSDWRGVKKMNSGSIHEKIHDAHNKYGR